MVNTFREAIDEVVRDRGTPTTYEDATDIVLEAVRRILDTKQKKYGRTFNKYGHHGIVMHTNEKVDRLYHGVYKNTDLGEEGILDSYGDLAGYSVLGMILENGWYDLP